MPALFSFGRVAPAGMPALFFRSVGAGRNANPFFLGPDRATLVPSELLFERLMMRRLPALLLPLLMMAAPAAQAQGCSPAWVAGWASSQFRPTGDAARLLRIARAAAGT